MKKTLLFLLSVFFVLFVTTSCKKSTTTEADEEKAETGGKVTISGKVIDNTTGTGIEGVTIKISGFNDRYSEAGGDFAFILDMSGNKELKFTFNIKGYETREITQDVNVAEKKLDLGTIRLEKQLINSSVTGPADAIQFVSMTSPNIFVQETGDITWTNITYVVVDSNGNPIDIDHSIPVTFDFLPGSHPNGGEEIGPKTVRSNSEGLVFTTVRSGTISGPVQVVARCTIGGKTIVSRPVKLTISGGFPHEPHFSVGISKLNFPAYGIVNSQPRPAAIAVVGDRYSNPVVEGTAVYFQTTAGVIEGYQDPKHTDRYGVAQADIMTGAPWPYDPDPVLGDGFYTVSAKTVDENNLYITKTTLGLWSGRTQIYDIVIEPVDENGNWVIPDFYTGGGVSFKFRVSDQFGNPLSEGTSINVTTVGKNLTVSGDTGKKIPDTMSDVYTYFEVVVSEIDPEGDVNPGSRKVSVIIEVKSPNGDFSVIRHGTAL